MTGFSSVLRRLREQAGHATARRFYNSSGGVSAFGCTYKQYANIEAGRCVPRPKVLKAILVSLRLWEEPEKAALFARAYLEALLGPGETVDFLTRALESAAAAAGGTPLQRAVRRDFEARSRPLSAAQSRLIRKDDVHYWAFTLLESETGSLSPDEMAHKLGFPAQAVRGALRDFERGDLARREGGRFHCPDAGKIFIHERPVGERMEVVPYLPQLRKRWDAMARKHGKVLFDQYLFVRASESEFSKYLPQLAQCVSGSEIYARTEKGPDTAFLLVEATVRRVMRF